MRLALASLLLAVVALPTTVHAQDSGTVFMFVRDGSRDLDLMLTQEVGVMRQMLRDAGFTVDIATSSGEPMVGDTFSLTPTIALDDVELDRYVGVVLPCMAPARGFGVPESVEDLTRQAVERGLPIAASRGSVETLAAAGGLTDRQYAFAGAVDVSERPEFAGGDFRGIGVVRDGTISTAGICPLASRSLGEPDGTVELMTQFIASLNERG